jgi:hypothetical protein
MIQWQFMRIDLLQMLFGDQLEVLLTDRTAVFDLLANGGWQQKCGALTLLRDHWELPPEILIPLYQSLAERDADDRVRCKAIYAIGQYRAYTQDEQLSRFIAGIALNLNNTDAVRACALRALRLLNRDSPSVLALQDATQQLIYELHRMKRDDITSDDLDWARTFL